MKKIKVVLIDSNLIFRKGFALYLNAIEHIAVIDDFSLVEELENYDFNGVDLLLFDTVSDEDYYLLSRIQKEQPTLNTLLLSSEKRIFENYLFAAMNNVNGFLSREVSPEIVIETIQMLAFQKASGIVLPENIRERLFGKKRQRSSIFSRKEINILGLLGKGKSTQEAAQILNSSRRTIETHRRRMIERIGSKNIIPVLMFALENEYIQFEMQDF
jgi:DNA-binding NarL/FixJ family response regulator